MSSDPDHSADTNVLVGLEYELTLVENNIESDHSARKSIIEKGPPEIA